MLGERNKDIKAPHQYSRGRSNVHEIVNV